MLQEHRRTQLDSIVSRMVANKESDSNIRFVVEDFKKKYEHEAQPGQPKTEKGFLQKAEDVVTSVFPGKQVGQAIGTLGGLAFEKAKGLLGGQDNSKFYDTSAPSPLQVAGDVATGAATVAGLKLPIAPSIVGKAAQFGALGGVAAGGSELAKTDDLGAAAGAARKGAVVGAGMGAGFGLAEKGIRGLGTLLGKTGDKIQTTVIKPSARDIKDGFSMETIKKYNLGGSLKTTFAKTDATLDDLSKQLNAKLAASNASVDLNGVYEKTAKRLLGAKLESFGSNAQMENAIEKLRSEILAVSGDNGLVSIPQAQIVKRASGHFGAWSFGVPTPEATASQKVYDTFYNELKVAIEKGSPEGVKQINQEISKLIPVMNALIRRIPVAERNASLSLTDIISLAAASVEPRALSLSLLNLASKSGTVGAALSKTGASMSNATLPTTEKLVRTGLTLGD